MSYESDNRDLLTVFKDGLGRGLRVLNIRSKEAYDTLRIKNSMRQLERQKRQAVYEMGAALYRTYKHTGKVVEETVAAKSADIDRIESEIEKQRQELEFVHTNAEKALGSLKAIAKPKAAAFCDCGAELREGAKYCPECLKKLG
jgi:hypothetical protein